MLSVTTLQLIEDRGTFTDSGSKQVSGLLHLFQNSDLDPAKKGHAGPEKILRHKIVLVRVRSTSHSKVTDMFKAGAAAVVLIREHELPEASDGVDIKLAKYFKNKDVGDIVSITAKRAKRLVRYATNSGLAHSYADDTTSAIKSAFAAYLWHAGLVVPAMAAIVQRPPVPKVADAVDAETLNADDPSIFYTVPEQGVTWLRELWRRFSNRLRLCMHPAPSDESVVGPFNSRKYPGRQETDQYVHSLLFCRPRMMPRRTQLRREIGQIRYEIV